MRSAVMCWSDSYWMYWSLMIGLSMNVVWYVGPWWRDCHWLNAFTSGQQLRNKFHTVHLNSQYCIKNRVFILFSTFFFADGIDLLLWLYSAHYNEFLFWCEANVIRRYSRGPHLFVSKSVLFCHSMSLNLRWRHPTLDGRGRVASLAFRLSIVAVDHVQWTQA